MVKSSKLRNVGESNNNNKVVLSNGEQKCILFQVKFIYIN